MGGVYTDYVLRANHTENSMSRKDKSTHNNTHHSLSRKDEKRNKRLANKRQRQKGKVQW